MGLDTKQVLQEIKDNPEAIQDMRSITGEDYKVLVTFPVFSEEISTQHEELIKSTPLMIATQNEQGAWEWNNVHLKDIGDRIGLSIGTSVDGAEDYKQSWYQERIVEDFNQIIPSGNFLQRNITKYPSLPGRFQRMAFDNNKALGIFHAFWRKDIPEELETASKEEIVQYMQSRVKTLLEYAEKGQRMNIVIVNEAFYVDQKTKKGTWYDLPFNKVGPNWIAEAYIMAYKQAEEMDLEIGKDVVFLYNSNAIEVPGEWSDYTYNKLVEAREIIAERLGIAEEEVKLDVGLQFHMHADPENKRGWDDVYTEDLVLKREEIIENIRQFSQIGNIHVTEIEISGTNDEYVKAKAITNLIDIVNESGAIENIVFFHALRMRDDGAYTLFRDEETTAISYWALLQTLLEEAKKIP
jgi:hypothetical protein